MKETFQTFAPLFPGFYGTNFEYNGEEDDIQYYNEENGTDLGYDDFEWDYKEQMNRVAKSFVNNLERELKYFIPVTLTFQHIHSPREYNFGNDAIYMSAELDLKELIQLIEGRKEEAAKYFKERYTSYDGFISFHSPDINDWLNEEYIRENPEHRVGGLLNCLCNIEIDEYDIYDWVSEENYIDFWPKEVVNQN